jgi:NADH-quinone oxidoreductase subunit G
MPTFKLNGQEIPFEKGDTIIRAAWRAGIEIPHYCWHPGLSVAANCRMCLVHVKSGRQMMMPILKWNEKKQAYLPDTKPKLVPACQQAAEENLEVDSVGPEVKHAQAAVQELLLLNHPVDCPICDQAGECKLQDYYEEHQHTLKRKRTEPVHKPKGVRFGPTIVYDAERCIMCTRCIRVCDELVGDHVLDMRERGNRNEIVVAPGRELDHDYTLMTEHVCPVGALTSRDFRFKARVWFLKSVEGICTGCATGCNSHVDFDPRYGKVYRLRPRDNAEVNRFWMCDTGMMTYHEVHEGRLVTPVLGRGPSAEKLLPEDAPAEAATLLGGLKEKGKLAVVLGAGMSSEDNFVAVRFAKLFGTSRLYLAAREADVIGWKGDAILKHADPNPGPRRPRRSRRRCARRPGDRGARARPLRWRRRGHPRRAQEARRRVEPREQRGPAPERRLDAGPRRELGRDLRHLRERHRSGPDLRPRRPGPGRCAPGVEDALRDRA